MATRAGLRPGKRPGVTVPRRRKLPHDRPPLPPQPSPNPKPGNHADCNQYHAALQAPASLSAPRTSTKRMPAPSRVWTRPRGPITPTGAFPCTCTTTLTGSPTITTTEPFSSHLMPRGHALRSDRRLALPTGEDMSKADTGTLSSSEGGARGEGSSPSRERRRRVRSSPSRERRRRVLTFACWPRPGRTWRSSSADRCGGLACRPRPRPGSG